MKNPPWLKDEIILVMDFYIDNSAKIPGKDSDEIAELRQQLLDSQNEILDQRLEIANLIAANTGGES